MVDLTPQTAVISLETKLSSSDEGGGGSMTSHDLIERAQLILCTVASAGRRDMVDTSRGGSAFDLVIVDEASQVRNSNP